MSGGVINVLSATGNVCFLDKNGDECIDPSVDVKVTIKADFPGIILKDAVDEAKRYAAGAIKKKVEQKKRGFDCNSIVKDIRIRYNIKYGFEGQEEFAKEIKFKAGEQIIKKGEQGDTIFWIKEGVIIIDRVEYDNGSVFGRSAFTDGIRKKDVYAKTEASVIAIHRNHPDLESKLPILLEKFAEEIKQVHKIRPKAKLDKIKEKDIC